MTAPDPNAMAPLDFAGLRLTMVSDFMPRHDASSSNFRIHHLLRMLEAGGARVTYLYCIEDPRDNEYAAMFGPATRFMRFPADPARLYGLVRKTDPELLWLTNIWLPDYTAMLLNLCTALRRGPRPPRIVLDTMDFHAKKHMRKFKTSKSPEDLRLAGLFLDMERRLYPLGDALVTVSEEERRDILAEVADCPPAHVIPNVHPVDPAPASPEGREGLVFLGNYAVRHNVDAAAYFVQAILPRLLELRPSAVLHLLGREAAERLGPLASDAVRPHGYVADLDAALGERRVFVCPMPYGAGMKGKVGSAVAAGLPVVTTGIGAEGFPFEDGRHCFIADDPEVFARRCLTLLTDDAVWTRMSGAAKALLAERFGVRAVSARLGEMMDHMAEAK